jgi:hypothetical protein
MSGGDWVAVYAAVVASGVALFDVMKWREGRKARDQELKLQFGTNIRIEEFGVVSTAPDVLHLQARIVNNSNHNVIIRHAHLRWASSGGWDFADGSDTADVSLDFTKISFETSEKDPAGEHRISLASDEIIRSHGGTKVMIWAGKSHFMANENERVSLHLMADDGTYVESAPLDWRSVTRGATGWG